MSIFTIRVKPFVGESLLSFMQRFSKANGVKFLKFWNMMKKSENQYAQMSCSYLLNYTPLNIIDCSKLIDATGLSERDIFDMTVFNILKKFSIKENFDRMRFLINLVEDEKFFYCPLCLKEKLFNRLIWNFKDVRLCLEHKISLSCICSKCGKILMQKDITEVGKCPYCFDKLTRYKYNSVSNTDEYKLQTFLQNSLLDLLSPKDLRFKPQELALKIMYILNEHNLDLNRELISKNISNDKLTSTLLQHARGTLYQERTLNLKFLISFLSEKRITMREFYELKVPQKFISSLLSKPEKHMEETFCKAPWCKNYYISNSLMKIPTSYHLKHNGDYKSYYSICPECGCEYTRISEGRIIERTNFIDAYNKLKNLSLLEKGLTELAEYCKVSKDKMIRFVAYFSSNNIIEPLDRYCNIKVNDKLIEKFIKYIQNGFSIEDIRHKKDWNNNYHYLIHRYNSKVVQAIAANNSKRHNNLNLEDKQGVIKDILSEMNKNNENITIDAVCKRLGIVHETIRLWKCNKIIQEMKKIQKIGI